MDTKVKSNSKWIDSEFNVYIVNNVTLTNNIWVEYTKVATGNKYNCLQEAFVSRFKEQAQ
jgi:hypothetical protein